MDWTAIIERNQIALRRILAMLTAMAGLAAHPEAPAAGAPRRTLPRHLHRLILRLLRPAEAAARRLIIIAARDVVVPPPGPPRPRKPVPTSIFVRNGKGTGIVLPRGVDPATILPGLARPHRALTALALPLTDALQRFPVERRPLTRAMPRISVPGVTQSRGAVRRPPLPDDAIDATRLGLRLAAVGRVLDDLPREARRFARWRSRAAAHPPLRSVGGGPKGRRGRLVRVWPLRPGRPPGSLRRPTHEVHDVLADLHHFAFHALERRDSS